MGIVYFALDRQAENKPCVVKQLQEPVINDEVLGKLQEEAKRMAALSQAIGGRMAEILEDFVDDGRFYVVQQRIYGRTLEEVFYERRPLAETEVVGWAIQCCRILQRIHEQKDRPVHRDISPDNLILSNVGDITMIDFGTLRELQHIAKGTAGMGKYGYTPREQWAGRPVPQSDLFALGATIYFLLTGYRALSEELAGGGDPQPSDFAPIYPPIRSVSEEASPELESILSRVLQDDVSLRYTSAEEMRADLEGLVKDSAETVPVAAPIVYCPECGQPNEADNVYCQSCLAILYPGSQQCPKGHANPVNARFCRKCGASLSAA
jgi:serine/threonine-protein kinase